MNAQATYNISGIAVTGALSAVHAVMIEVACSVPATAADLYTWMRRIILR